MTNCALTVGILAASANPLLSSCFLTVSITAARLTCTALPLTSTEPPVLPVSTATIWSWAARLASIHACSNCGVWTSRSTCLCTKLSTPLASGVASAERLAAARGGRPRELSASTASWVIALTSRRAKISAVTRSAMAFCTAGSDASGVTVSTYRLVSPISSWAQAATTDSGASRPTSTSSTVTTIGRHTPPRSAGAGAGPGATCSVRPRSTSACSRAISACSRVTSSGSLTAPG